MRADRIDADYVIRRLDEAYQTMLGFHVKAPELSGVGNEPPEHRVESTAAEISEMDEASAWLSFIGNRTIRRIVSLRSQRRPDRRHPINSWAKVGKLVHASESACKAWHGQGIATIVNRLREDVA